MTFKGPETLNFIYTWSAHTTTHLIFSLHYHRHILPVYYSWLSLSKNISRQTWRSFTVYFLCGWLLWWNALKPQEQTISFINTLHELKEHWKNLWSDDEESWSCVWLLPARESWRETEVNNHGQAPQVWLAGLSDCLALKKLTFLFKGKHLIFDSMWRSLMLFLEGRKALETC